VAKRRHFTVYWNEQEEGMLMKHLDAIARHEKRSKSSTMLVALRQYVAQYLEEAGETDGRLLEAGNESQRPEG
jgi:hypothetical protein